MVEMTMAEKIVKIKRNLDNIWERIHRAAESVDRILKV